MHTNNARISLLALGLALGLALPATSQNPPPLDEQMGVIPGSNMTRDEFRARANAQLSAIALNAETFFLLHGKYPESYYALFNSECWNLDPQNLFTGGDIDAIYFDPQPTDLIPSYDSGLPPGLENLPTIRQFQDPSPSGSGNEGSAEGQGPTQPASPPPISLDTNVVLKVDPARVYNTGPGNIYYRAVDKTLQLVVFAPDNTYHELFHNSPNRYWHKMLSAGVGGSHWSEDVLAGQVLFFTENMLPQFYNHVMFMADLEVLPGSALGKYGVDARLQMAEELGITILNPYSKQQIQLVEGYDLGSFVEPHPADPLPLYLCLVAKRIMTRKQILEGQLAQSRAARKGQQTRNPRRPALGGSR